MARFDEKTSDLGRKMINLIRENLFEKIGREEWNKKPLEERHKLEIECIDKNFDLSKMSKEDLEKVADYLEDSNYHGPANYLRKIADVPFWDFSKNEMVYPSGEGSKKDE
jgi:hypothetical protein